MIPALVLSITLAGVATPEYTECKLAKRITVYDEKICVYVYANGGTQLHYPTRSCRECPSRFMCKYSPAKDKGPTLKETLDALKGQFE